MKNSISVVLVCLALGLLACSSRFPGDYRGQLSINVTDDNRTKTAVGQVKALVIEKDKTVSVQFSETDLITGCELAAGLPGGGRSCTVSVQGVSYPLKVDDVRFTKNGDGIIITIDGSTSGGKDFARITFVQ